MVVVERVVATDAALALIEKLKKKHGPVMFHQSGGCCDGSSPMCYPEGDLIIGDADIFLGEIGGARFICTNPNLIIGSIHNSSSMSWKAVEECLVWKE